MTVQCPHCQTKYRLEEKPSREQSSMRLPCSKCGQTFSIVFAVSAERSTPARPVPVQHHDEFNKRLRSVAQSLQPSPDSLKATMIRSNSRPWLAADKVVSLVVIDGPLKGRVFPLTKPKISLGRSEADIVLEDSEISRKHCALEVHGTSAMLADLGSTNGTFVDDERIETHQLQHMSEFRLGSTVMMFSARAKD